VAHQAVSEIAGTVLNRELICSLVFLLDVFSILDWVNIHVLLGIPSLDSELSLFRLNDLLWVRWDDYLHSRALAAHCDAKETVLADKGGLVEKRLLLFHCGVVGKGHQMIELLDYKGDHQSLQNGFGLCEGVLQRCVGKHGLVFQVSGLYFLFQGLMILLGHVLPQVLGDLNLCPLDQLLLSLYQVIRIVYLSGF